MWLVLCSCQIQSWSWKNDCRSSQPEMDNEVPKRYYVHYLVEFLPPTFLSLPFVPSMHCTYYILFPVTSNSQYYANADYLQHKFKVPLWKSYLELHLAYSSWRDRFWMCNNLKSHSSVLGGSNAALWLIKYLSIVTSGSVKRMFWKHVQSKLQFVDKMFPNVTVMSTQEFSRDLVL